MGAADFSHQLAVDGLKRKLRRVRYARTKQEKLFNQVGIGKRFALIDPAWLAGAFQKIICDLDDQEKEILDRIRELNRISGGRKE